MRNFSVLFLTGMIAGCGNRTIEPPTPDQSPPIEAHANTSALSDAATTTQVPCGPTGMPDCPLQGWMKANARRPLSTGDLPRLEKAFERIETFDATDYPEWKVFAQNGKQAAAHGELDDARRACKQCHDAYRDAYRQTRRAQAIR